MKNTTFFRIHTHILAVCLSSLKHNNRRNWAVGKFSVCTAVILDSLVHRWTPQKTYLSEIYPAVPLFTECSRVGRGDNRYRVQLRKCLSCLSFLGLISSLILTGSEKPPREYGRPQSSGKPEDPKQGNPHLTVVMGKAFWLHFCETLSCSEAADGKYLTSTFLTCETVSLI